MEFTRIYKNKKILFLILVLLSLNVIFYIKDQYTNQYHLSDQRTLRNECAIRYQDMDVQAAADDLLERQQKAQVMSELYGYETMKEEMGEFLDKEMQKMIQEYEQKHIAEYKDYLKNKKQYSEEQFCVEMEVYSELYERYCHVLEFQEKLDQIQKNDETMSQISIFKNNKSTGKSIDKTTKDYQRLKDTTVELGNDDFITSVCSYEKSAYFVFVFVLVLVWQMLAERKKGLWVVVYASAKGRMWLAVRRVGVILASISLYVLANQGILFLASGIIYGFETNINRSIQSIPLFSSFTIPMSEMQFIGIYCLTVILASVFMALFVWFVFVVADNRMIALFLMLVVYLAGYLLYANIAEQSYMVVLKYLNFFYFLNAAEMFSSYFNFKIAGQVLNRIPVIYAFLAVGIALFAVSGVVVDAWGGRWHKESLLVRMAEWLIARARCVTAHFSILGMELYKILVIQKGAVILLVLLYLCASNLNSYPLYYTPKEEFMNAFYAEYKGPLTKDAVQYMLDSEKEAAQKTKAYEEAMDAYKKGELNEEEKVIADMKYEAASGIISGSAELRTHLTYLTKAQKVLNEPMWVVNPMGYERLLGDKSYERQVQENLKVMVATLLMMASVFAFERKKGTKEILCATLRGRDDLLEKKILAGGLCAALAFACVKITSFVSLAQLFTFSGWNALLKSLSSMAYNSWNGTIWQYYVFVLVLQFVVILVYGMLAGAVSAVLPSEMTIIAGMIPLVPSFLDAFGMGVPMCLSLARISTIVEWQSSMWSGGSYVKYMVLAVGTAVVSVMFMRRFWCGKAERSRA